MKIKTPSSKYTQEQKLSNKFNKFSIRASVKRSTHKSTSLEIIAGKLTYAILYLEQISWISLVAKMEAVVARLEKV